MVPWTFIVPTDGASPYLFRLLSAAPEAVERIVIWTADTPPPISEFPVPCTVLVDTELPKNIQRWWNTGIRASSTDIVVIANDDVEVPAHALDGLANGLYNADCTLAMIAGFWLSGWLFALDRSDGILPDEGYIWHCGDLELLARARHEGRCVLLHPIPGVQHRKFRDSEITTMRDAVMADGHRWRASPYH